MLSEHVFCPRAALIAHETGPDQGDEEPCLGPRLDFFADYDEQRFAEELHQRWGELRLWLTLSAPAILLVLLAVYFHSPLAGLVVSLPLMLLAERCWHVLTQIIAVVRERAAYRAVTVAEIEMAPTEVKKLNWWSLRKAGVDCDKLVDSLSPPEGELKGNPWRILKQGNTIEIPVIRRHRGRNDWGPQHEVRLAAYCRLIEKCEGRSSPFGVILFAGTHDCVIIPNTAATEMRLELAIIDAQEFLAIQDRGTHIPAAPTDNRCAGCPHGEPRLFQRGASETVLNGEQLPAYTTNSVRKSDGRLRGVYHCVCGDRFKWIPPHKEAIRLGVAKET